MLYRIFRAMARLALHLFFRQIEVEGRENVPDQGPLLLVSNHTNALVDPLVLVITVSRRLTVTAKNVLAKNPLLGLLMSCLGVVTFHRREDAGKGADPRQNIQSLQQCRQILASGGALCIFPEGVSHSDLKLRPFHLGPARIALDFAREEGDPGGLRIVPIGLLYSQKDRFRSAVWLRYGTPMDVGQWLAEHPGATAADFTKEITGRVQALILHYENRRESLILSCAAEIVATRGRMPPPLGRDERSVAEWFQLLSGLQSGYRTLLANFPDDVNALSTRMRQYRAELKKRGMTAAEIFLPVHPGRALLFLIRELELLLVGAPVALFGAVNHFLPYQIVKWIARALSTDKDHWASNIVYPSFLVFPIFYLLQLGAAWFFLPSFWAFLYTVALPYTGYYALIYGERAGRAFRRTRTFLYLLRDREGQTRLAAEGRAILEQIQALGSRLPVVASPDELDQSSGAPPNFVENPAS